MIKLDRPSPPNCLKDLNKVLELTEEFKKSKKNVWNIEELKDALLALSYGKCCYCECKITEESKYLEVEHFVCKSLEPDQVLEWENLLPSCKRCNLCKSKHNVKKFPIIDPCKDTPRSHLKLKYYRLKGTTSKGKSTIDVVQLNDSRRLTQKRFEIGEKVLECIEQVLEKLNTYKQNSTTKNKNKLIMHLRELLLECHPKSEYSATAATVLHKELNYKKLKKELQNHGLWNQYLQTLDDESSQIVLG